MTTLLVNKATAFESVRPLLHSIAYKMTASVADSEDILQDVLEKWLHQEAAVINSKAYLAKAVANTALNYLKKRKQEQDNYFGLWLPEPLTTPQKEGYTVTDEQLDYGFMLLMEKLSPLERGVYLLRESFGTPYDELADSFGIKQDHCRQLYHRAKEKLSASKRHHVDPARKKKILNLFEEACLSGNLTTLIEQLREDVVFYSDGGGKVPAAVNNIHGKKNASKFLKGIYSKNGIRAVFKFAYLNNSPAAVVFINGKPDTIAILAADAGGISEMYFVRNPDKIQHLHTFL
ncbi:sigma-70 family RNA polymerase sigma factor [Pontibacter cellulosilyticus]|uniref:Sigma-70 family RNA polymerase sigma factor n=1 Tax=Pontibacter cellulosilyticus TaxID=1720253 RepID=A0A923N9J6_9BACT|nr:sigma-70 family RNA polymerase sigma factor [Pontibacter cellulosilyticus]MBC5993392.1 sigma-70 family RNA polymerase sigma factor [Pontibacter cellulosilyticus]